MLHGSSGTHRLKGGGTGTKAGANLSFFLSFTGGCCWQPSLHPSDATNCYNLAALAIRRSDVRILRQCGKSTVGTYLHSHSHIDVFPNNLQPYLEGPMTAGMRANKLLFKTGFAPVQHLHARKYATAADGAPGASCPFCPCEDETAAHFALRCPQFAKWCTAMRAALRDHVGEHAFRIRRVGCPAG
jgi:hypothetical protein